MEPELWQRIKALLAENLDGSPEERAACLARVRREDAALANQLAVFLNADEQKTAFLEEPLIRWQAPARAVEPESIGPYRVVRKLGQGGMGAVYLAVRADGEYEREVAIKVLKRGMDTEEIIGRFRAERQILATLSHPNIAQFHDGGTTAEDLPYFVMEHVAGEPIHHFCTRHWLSVKERLVLFRKVCEAVHFAHQNLIIHRDLKPGNILVTPGGEPKLLDFGIAKVLNPQPFDTPTGTTAALRLMTPEYASPEQVRGEPVTTAADIYALGVLLYEPLTGHRPYSLANRSDEELKQIICQREPEKPSMAAGRALQGSPSPETTRPGTDAMNGNPRRLRRTLAGELDNIVLMAMRKEPGRRYATVQQFSEDIGHYLAGRPVRARKENLPYLAGKFIRRHRFGVAMLTLTVLLVAAFVGALIFQERQTRRERDGARQTADFLKDMFQVIDPYAADSDTITVPVLLDKAARDIHDLETTPEVRASLMQTIGDAYGRLGHYDRAEFFLCQVLEIQETLWGQDARVARTLYHLGDFHLKQGQIKLARDELERALFIQKRTLGPNHHLYAKTMDSLASAYVRLGQLDQAEFLFKRALDIQVAIQEQSNAVASILQSLAGLYRRRGAYEQAEPLFQRALHMNEHLDGKDSPTTAYILNNMALLYRDQGRYVLAENLYTRALAITERAFGKGHPNTLDVLNNLASLYQARGCYAEAEPLHQRVLEIRERLGLKGVEVVLNNLARARYELGRYASAETLYLRALDLDLGREGSFLAPILSNLALLYRDQGDFDRAEPLYTQARDIIQARWGTRHPHFAKALHNLAELYRLQGSLDRAQALHSRAFELRERILTSEHPATADSLYHLALVSRAEGRLAEAEALCQRALQLREKAFEPHHPRVTEARELLHTLTFKEDSKDKENRTSPSEIR